MWIIYSIPILPIVLLVLGLFNVGASFIRDCLPIISGLLIIKNIYVDLYCSIVKEDHNPGSAILQFFLGIVRVLVIVPIVEEFLTYNGGLFALIGLIFSVILIVPIIGYLWLLGELSSLCYGIGSPDYSSGKAVWGNIISIGCILAIYLFFLL